jgi:hypothetical protein
LLGKKNDSTKVQIPTWLQDAKCFGILRTSGEIIDPAVKLFFDAVAKNFDQVIPKPKEDELDKKIDEVIEKKKDFE